MLQSTRRLILPLLTLSATITPIWAAPRQIPVSSGDTPVTSPVSSPPVDRSASNSGGLALTMRRANGAVEVVVQGTGPAPVLQQQSGAGVWQGQLNLALPNGLRYGPQRMSLPEAGLQSVSISGSGNTYQLEVTAMPGLPLAKPMVSADGANLLITFAANRDQSVQTGQLDLRQPGSVPQPAYAPPLQPRAVAPPLGDMAVGSMILKNQAFVNLRGPRVTLTLRRAKAIDALQLLARMGGYGFVFVDDRATAVTTGGQAAQSSSGSAQVNAGGANGNASLGAGANASASSEAYSLSEGAPVTLSFVEEDYSRAINSVLMAGNLQGKLDGNILFAGPSVIGKTFGSQVSKVYRLNQASSSSAADYLASLGAAITKVNVITNTVAQGTSQSDQVSGAAVTQQTQVQRITSTETYGGGAGPLRGLIGTTDSRLQTVTLIGNPQLLAVAEGYLRQIDLRQRQVALSVKILDVTLDNDAAISNSFAFRYGNNFIVSDRGQLVGAFGGLLPPNSNTFDAIAGGAQSGKTQIVTATGENAQVASQSIPPIDPAPINPGRVYQAENFYDLVKAVVTSASTKTLASPTLFLSDNPESNSTTGSGSSDQASSSGAVFQSVTNPGSPIGRSRANEAFVVVGAQEITSYTVVQGQGTAPNTCQPVFQTAGLTLGARVKRIDDNGFVTFNLSPSITALTGTSVTVEGCGAVRTLAVRALDTGDVRVRDGQTLILTGVISDQDIQVVRKWPILGDIPFVGQFFRDSSNGRKKRELVILVTPRVINDGQGGAYGYGYSPQTRDAREFLGAASGG